MDRARAHVRACLQCPCAGDPGPLQPDEAIEGALVTLEQLLLYGDRKSVV